MVSIRQLNIFASCPARLMMAGLPFAPGTRILALFSALFVVNRRALWARECVVSQWKDDLLTVAKLAQVTFSSASLATLGDVVKEDLVNLGQVAQEVPIVEIN